MSRVWIGRDWVPSDPEVELARLQKQSSMRVDAGRATSNQLGYLCVSWALYQAASLTKILFESDCRSGGYVATHPARIVAGAVYEIGPTRRTVVRGDGFASRNVHRAATLHACIRDDCRAVRTDAEVVSREVAQGFECFIEEILVDDRLAVLARFHGDAYSTS